MKFDELFDQRNLVAIRFEKLHSRSWLYEDFSCKEGKHFKTYVGQNFKWKY